MYACERDERAIYHDQELQLLVRAIAWIWHVQAQASWKHKLICVPRMYVVARVMPEWAIISRFYALSILIYHSRVTYSRMNMAWLVALVYTPEFATHGILTAKLQRYLPGIGSSSAFCLVIKVLTWTSSWCRSWNLFFGSCWRKKEIWNPSTAIVSRKIHVVLMFCTYLAITWAMNRIQSPQHASIYAAQELGCLLFGLFVYSGLHCSCRTFIRPQPELHEAFKRRLAPLPSPCPLIQDKWGHLMVLSDHNRIERELRQTKLCLKCPFTCLRNHKFLQNCTFRHTRL